jgi:hypothetical protein
MQFAVAENTFNLPTVVTQAAQQFAVQQSHQRLLCTYCSPA